MASLFVYGSLKQGFCNEHVNTGVRVEGRYRTLKPFPMYLLGDGEVPCIVDDCGSGHRIVGELYEVTDNDLRRMDRLERVGEADGYDRIVIDVERFDADPAVVRDVFVYVKREEAIPGGIRRIGPIDEYTLEHARNFRWTGLDPT